MSKTQIRDIYSGKPDAKESISYDGEQNFLDSQDGGENKCPEKSQDFFSRVRTGMKAHSGLCNRIPVRAIGKKDKIFGI